MTDPRNYLCGFENVDDFLTAAVPSSAAQIKVDYMRTPPWLLRELLEAR